MFNAQMQCAIPWLAHVYIIWCHCQCPTLENPRQVADEGLYMWSPEKLSCQSCGCRAGADIVEEMEGKGGGNCTSWHCPQLLFSPSYQACVSPAGAQPLSPTSPTP